MPLYRVKNVQTNVKLRDFRPAATEQPFAWLPFVNVPGHLEKFNANKLLEVNEPEALINRKNENL